MANQPLTTLAQDWATPFNRLEELNLYLDRAPAHERDAVEREIAALQDELLDMPAPTLTAVRQKLEMLFEGQMHGLDQASEERRLAIEDLDRLINAQRAILGA